TRNIKPSGIFASTGIGLLSLYAFLFKTSKASTRAMTLVPAVLSFVVLFSLVLLVVLSVLLTATSLFFSVLLLVLFSFVLLLAGTTLLFFSFVTAAIGTLLFTLVATEASCLLINTFNCVAAA